MELSSQRPPYAFESSSTSDKQYGKVSRGGESGPSLRVEVCISPDLTGDAGSTCEDEDAPLVSELCAALGQKREDLTHEIQKMECVDQHCKCALKQLQREEQIWAAKLEAIQKKKSSAEEQRAETELLLELHQYLAATESLAAAVKTIQQTSSSEVPEDIKVMVEDCLNTRQGLNVTACVVCFTEFTAADLLSPQTSEKCRHAIHPCGHAVVCGHCAKQIWSTGKKCPFCRVQMTRSPKIFKPGRWQIEKSANTDQ